MPREEDKPSDNQGDDHALIDAMNAGPPAADDALASLYRRHAGWCLRVARRLTRDEHTAADIVQQAFIAFAGQFPGFQLRGKLTTWFYPVLRNRALGEARAASRARPVANPPESASVSPADLPHELAPLREAVAGLPLPLREVLLMRVVDGMSVSEVAIALGIPTGTVKSRLHTALERLRADERTQRYFGE